MPHPIAVASISAQAWRMMELAPISSFADDSPQAQDAREQYPIALGMCLEDYDWSFARRLVKLPPAELPDGEHADDDLPHTYILPGELLTLRLVKPKAATWRIDGDILRADQSGGVTIRYTRKITDETKLPSTFQTAVSAQLAVLLMPRWVKTRTKKADLGDALDRLLAKARKNDRQSGSSDRVDGQPQSSDWASEAVQ